MVMAAHLFLRDVLVGDNEKTIAEQLARLEEEFDAALRSKAFNVTWKLPDKTVHVQVNLSFSPSQIVLDRLEHALLSAGWDSAELNLISPKVLRASITTSLPV